MVVMAYFLKTPLRDDVIRQALRIADEQGIYVDYGAVWGNIFGAINFSHLTVLQDEDHYLQADRVQLSYRLIPYLFERRIDIRSVRLIRPRIRWVLPEERPEEPEPFDPEFSLDLAAFHIRSGRIELADTLIFDEIQLDATLHVRPHQLYGRLRRASATVYLKGAERLRLRSAKTNFAYAAPDTVHLKDLSVRTRHSELRGEIHLQGASWDVTFKKADIDLSEIDPEMLQGHLLAQGRVGEDSAGFAGGFRLDLEGMKAGKFKIADVTAVLEGKGGSFDLSLSASDDKLGRIVTSGNMRLDREFVSVNLELEEVNLITAPDWPLTCKGEIAVDYRIRQKRGEIKARLEKIGIHTMQWEHCSFDAAFAGAVIEVREFLLTHGFTRIEAAGTLSPDTLTGSVSVQGLQMSSLGELNPLNSPAEADAQLQIEGTRDAPLISGILLVRSQEAFFEKIEAEFTSFDPVNFLGKAILDVEGISSPAREKINLTATVEDGFLQANASAGPHISLSTSGLINLDSDRKAREYNCDRLVLVVNQDTIENRFPFVAGQAGDSIYLSPTFFFVGAGELATAGSWRPGALPRWELSVYDVELATLGRIFDLPEEMSGLVWGQIASRGEGDRRRIIFDLGASGLNLEDLNADSLAISGSLDTTMIEFEAALVGSGTSNANGHLTYSLKDTIPVQSFDVHLTLDDIGVRPFEFLRKVVQVRSGTITGDLHASGTLDKPDLKGWVYVRGGELYVPVIDLTCRRADADILFNNGKVIVDRLDANVGAGSVQGRGDYDIFTENHPFFFGFRFKEVVFSPDRHISALCTGNITLEGTQNTPLLIDGKIDLKQALITYGLGDEIKVTSPNAPTPNPDRPPPPPTYINLTIKGEKNIWIRNNDMDIEVAPDLEIIQRDELIPQIVGDLRVKRGKVYYLDHQFRLDPARSKIIFPPTEELDPEFDIWASMGTNETDSSRGAPQVIKITLHMAGTLTEPILEFYSDPPVWSESEIISYLHLNLATAFIQGVVRDVTNPVKDWARLDVLSIEDFGISDVPTKVTFGKYISDKLFASYTLSLSKEQTGNQHQFRIEYEVGRNQDIVLERDEEGAHNLRYQIKIRY